MGRSRRKNALEEALRPLEDAGLPEGWGDFWYGASDEVVDAQSLSALGKYGNQPSSMMSEKEILEEIGRGDLQPEDLHIGHTLYNSDNNNREYRGKIAIKPTSSGRWVFVGVVQWSGAGNLQSGRKQVLYEGESLNEASRKVNERIGEKIKGGYLPRIGSGQVYAVEARKRLEQLLDNTRT